MSYMTNVVWDWMNPGIKILPLPRANDLLWGRMSGEGQGNFLTSGPWYRKLSLKIDEPQVGQLYKDVE